MPVTPTYPGVYIEELPSSVRPITGVATSVAAFIDDFHRGPQDVAVQILGMADFERVYGGLSATSEGSYAIQQFFLNGGTQAWVVRVCETETIADPDPVKATTAAAAAKRDINGGASTSTVVAVASAGRRVRGVDYADPGAWGKEVRIDIDYDTNDPTKSFNLTVSEVRVADGRATIARSETFRNLVIVTDDPRNLFDVVNESSAMLHLAPGPPPPPPPPPPAAPPPPPRPFMTGTVTALLDAPPAADIPITITITPGGAAPVAISTGPITVPFSDLPPNPTWEQARALLQTTLQSIDPADPASRFLSEATVQLVRTQDDKQRLRVLLARPAVLLDPDLTVTFTIPPGGALDPLDASNAYAQPQQLKLADGVDGTPPRAKQLQGMRATRTGMFALEEADLFNLMCIPCAADLPDAQMRTVVTAATAYCEERRSFMLLDIPGTIESVDQMQAWMADHDDLRHRNLAVYYPRVRISDPLRDDRLRAIAASGTLAGVYAQTDSTRGAWKAPAGTEAGLRGVPELHFRATDAQNGTLNPIGVNTLRTFPIHGNLSWGSRTLVGADALSSPWKYVPVRRTALYLEESLLRGLKWAVFEPNDEPLWAQIRLNAGAFLHGLFRKGAFQGRSAREAYLVKCDGETTTQTDIDLGIVNVVVGFAPLKPAEFVILQIQQLAGKIEA